MLQGQKEKPGKINILYIKIKKRIFPGAREERWSEMSMSAPGADRVHERAGRRWQVGVGQMKHKWSQALVVAAQTLLHKPPAW